MAYLYPLSGRIREVQPVKPPCFTLEELQAYVGGYIQLVPLPDGRQICCNEEGKLAGLRTNLTATELFRAHLLPGDFLVGDVLVLAPGDLDESA